MNNITITKIEKNSYIIKILDKINIYNPIILKEISKKIINKIRKKNILLKHIIIEVYPSKYETIIELKDYNKLINFTNEIEVKINIHTDTILLYKIDYLIIKDLKYNGNIYYYKNNFYLKINNIEEKDYVKLSELSNIVYKNTEKIIENGLKIKI